jgi:outer membrane protein assembly factor BamB
LCWLGAATALCAAYARAESVPIGRYSELRAGAAAGHPWATSGGDDGRTGRSRAHVPSKPPSLVWRLNLNATHVVPPAVRADGMLLIGASDGLHAIDPRGEQRWFAAIGAVRYTPALGPEGESAAIAQGRLFLIDPSGRARELEIAAPAMSAPLLLDSGALVVIGMDERAHVLGLDGAYLAGAPSGAGPSRWTLASGDGWVVVAGFGRELTLVSPYGDATRSVRLPGGLAVSPVASDGVIWAIGQSGSLWLIGARDHVSTLAELGLHGVGVAPALGHDGALRVALRHGEIACHDATGKERWRRGIDGAPSAMLVDADDTTLLISSRGTLYAIARDGSLLWRQRTELSGAGRPVLAADGTVYLVGRGGRIEAWR